MVDFCGDPFWDNFNVIRNSTSPIPVPTECFSHTVLVGIPCLFFWLLLPALVFQVHRSNKPALPWTILQSMKWLVTSVIMGLKFFLLVLAVWEKVIEHKNVPIIDYVYPIVMCVTLLAMLIMKNECRRAGIHSPGILFCTWLLFVVFGIPEFYAWIKIGSSPELVSQTDFLRYVCYLTYFPLVIIQLFLHTFADPLNVFGTEEDRCPEQRASFLNRQTMWWYSKLVSIGNKKPLVIEDLFELDEELKPTHLSELWDKEWSKAVRDYQVRKGEHDMKEKIDNETDQASHLLTTKKKGYGSTEEHRNQHELPADVELPSIVGTLWRIFKWQLLTASSFKLISDLLQYANPGFLNLLIGFTEDPTAPWWEGVAYAIFLFVAAEFRSLFMNNYYGESIRIGTGIQSVLTTAVYDKTLRLSNAARRQKTQGEIVNLMAIDVDRFRMITPQLQQYWSSPMQITISLFLLSQTVGYSVIAGLIVMVTIIPINLKVSSISKKWTFQQMKLKDERIRLSNEVLSGIKVVKLYAWEPALESVIDEIREKEMHLVKKASIAKFLADMLNIAAPFFVALATFTMYILTDSSHVLTPQIAFVSITLFNQLRGPLMMAADIVQQTIQCIVSNKRLKEFLVAEELCDTAVDQEDRGEFYDTSVEVDTATFAWESTMPPQLNNIEMKTGRGELLAVVGSVAAGKSSLLMALLGEMEKIRGYVGVRGMAAFVAQQPWIQNKTLRDNILMDKPYNKIVYDDVVKACALKSDLEQLPNGDMTEIGEKGINLSGGQKARIALARAVYQDRDVYLMDDPLSAVDAHVASHIFEHVIGPQGLLAKKTRILVTHGLSFLKECHRIAVVKNGTITHIDTYDNLLENEETVDILKEADTPVSEGPSTPSSISEEPQADDEVEELQSVVSRTSKRSRVSRKSTKAGPRPDELQKLIQTEKAETGRVKFKIYTDYFKSAGIFAHCIPFLITMCLNSAFIVLRSLWLAAWSNENVPGADPAAALPVAVRLGGYAILGFTEVFFLCISMIMIILGGVAASLRLHKPLLHNIMRSPLSFFDVTPLGRILNRLGKDMELVDLRLSNNIRFFFIAFFSVTQTCFIVTYSTPLFIIILVPIFIVYILTLRYFIDSSRQLQRLASLFRSPIYSHFGDTIQGAATIRAFRWQENFKKENKKKLETYVRCSYFSMLSQRWLSIRLELLGNIVILATAFLAVLSKNWGSMTAGLIGLSVSYSLNITFMLNMFVRQVSEVETNIVSVERVREYTFTPTEAEWRGHRQLPIGWPAKGRLVIKDYTTRYRPGLDLVLKGLSLNILPGQRIGVVGRTGAGKSSLALALFRIVEPASGQIILDDVDVSTIGLHDLRENITIIPQDPVLFSGTLRFNLDPTDKYDDASLWTALEHSNLRQYVEMLPLGLDHHIDEGGDNISVGQRQLVCLTRALLRKSRVLVLDEATAAVDQQTDALIQATIRKEFSSSTVITIAHRLNTIMDYDKVLVMEKGKAAEFDSPQQLLTDKKSIFYSMAQSAKLI